MAEKYIKINKETTRSDHNHMDDAEKNLIFIYTYCDTTYDRPSEFLGYFYDAAYDIDGKIERINWVSTGMERQTTPKDWGDYLEELEFPSKEFKEKEVVEAKQGDHSIIWPDFHLYINKNKAKDIKVVDTKIIYKDKYSFGWD